jgi:hypothetical protein
MDIVQNSIRAEATKVEIRIEENIALDLYSITISDNGKGMDSETLEKVTDPFFTTRTTRRVGMGLSLFKQNAELCRGQFSIESEVGKGCKVSATFTHSNIDRPVLGDISGTLYLLMACNQNVQFVYEHKTDKGTFKLDSFEVYNEIENVPITNSEIKKAIISLIISNLENIEFKQ